ncbi:hypothetical protein GTY60_20755 [Streptomyces sp. SID8367]|nr:hypothetical protein [Streptomyces sp. SID8367]
MEWYANIPFLLVVGVCLLADAASKKRRVRFFALVYLLLVDVAVPYEASRKDGWNWVVWVDMVLLLVVTLLSVGLARTASQENAAGARPAPFSVAPNRPLAAPRRHTARVEALRRQAERARSRRR